MPCSTSTMKTGHLPNWRLSPRHTSSATQWDLTPATTLSGTSQPGQGVATRRSPESDRRATAFRRARPSFCNRSSLWPTMRPPDPSVLGGCSKLTHRRLLQVFPQLLWPSGSVREWSRWLGMRMPQSSCLSLSYDDAGQPPGARRGGGICEAGRQRTLRRHESL